MLHNTLRYLAYRRFVRWVFFKLGRNNRKVIPCCAVKEIQKTYPAENSQYKGFDYPF